MSQETFNQLLEGITTIAFDFDGILADSEKWHFATYSEVFARHGHHIDETEYYKYWTSLGGGARLEIERYQLDLDAIAMRDAKREVFSKRCRDGSIKLFPEATEILDLFQHLGLLLGIASGSQRWDIEAILDNAQASHYFADIVGVDTAPNTKPAPDSFQQLLQRLDRNPSECLVFEDAEKGIDAAHTCGMRVIAVRTPETEHIDFDRANLVLPSHAEWLRLMRAFVKG